MSPRTGNSASGNRDEQILQVDRVLTEIGAQDVRQILVLNQIDRSGLEPGLERDEYGRIRKIRLSAKTGEGLPLLRQALVEHKQHADEKWTESPQSGITA